SEKCKYTAHLSSLLSLTQKVADKLYELDDDDEDDHSRHHGHGVIPVIAVTDSQVADSAAPDNSCRCTEGNNRNDRQRDRLSDSSFRFRNQHIRNDKEQCCPAGDARFDDSFADAVETCLAKPCK